MANFTVFRSCVCRPDPEPGPTGAGGSNPPPPWPGSPSPGASAPGGGSGVPGNNEGSGSSKPRTMGDKGVKRRGDPANHKQPCDCGHVNCGKNRTKDNNTPPPPSSPEDRPPGERPPIQILPPRPDDKKNEKDPPKIPLNFASIGTAFAFLLGVAMLIFAGSQKPVTDDQKKNSTKAFDDLGRVYAGRLYDNPYITSVVNFITVHVAIVAEHSGDKIMDWIRKKPPKNDNAMRPGEKLDAKTTVL